MVSQADIVQIVREEIESGEYPFPVELIESLIQVESGFKPGVVNKNSGASGLMQIMPIALKDYNLHNWPKLEMVDLQGSSISSVRNQIKTGLWILGTFWKGAYSYLQPRTHTVPLDELVRIADLFYVAGPAATKTRLSKLPIPTFVAVSAANPKWNALPHPNKVWTWTQNKSPQWDLEAIDRWVRSGNAPIVAGFDGQLGAFMLAAIILIFGWYYLNRKKKDE